MGWYASSGAHGADNENFFVGGSSYRNFFVFDTTDLADLVARATRRDPVRRLQQRQW